MDAQLQSVRKRQRELYEASRRSKEPLQAVASPQTGLDPEVLAELPPDIRAEVLREHAAEQQRLRESKAKSIAKEALANAKVDAGGSSSTGQGSNFADLIQTVVQKGGGEASLLDLLQDDSDEAPEAIPPPAKHSRPTLIKASLSKAATDALKDRTAPAGKFRLLSWNIDGLDEFSQREANDLSGRTAAICEEICNLGASVVFLQEVVSASLAVIRRLLEAHFHIHVPRNETCPYFCVVLLQRDKMEPQQAEAWYQAFPNSCMGRGLLGISAKVKGSAVPVLLCTSHLESTKPCADERHAQLLQSLARLASASRESSKGNSQVALLAGDLNLRDDEAKRGIRSAEEQNAGTFFLDAWELCGSDPACRFTWDPNENSNAAGFSGRPGSLPKCRFDRLFLAAPGEQVSVRKRGAAAEAAAKELAWQPRAFSLVGKTTRAAGRFLSDHWGVLVDFEDRNI